MRRLAHVVLAAATVTVAAACEVEDKGGLTDPPPLILSMDPPSATVEPGTVTRFTTWGGGIGGTPLAPVSCATLSPVIASAKVAGNGCEATALGAGKTVVIATMSTGATVAVELIVR